MVLDPKDAADRLDVVVEASNPVDRSRLATPAIDEALDAVGAAITNRREAVAARWGPRSVRRQRTVAAVAAVLVGSATVAAAAGLSAHTGQFQPTQEQIASASPSDAGRMRSELSMGGPG